MILRTKKQQLWKKRIEEIEHCGFTPSEWCKQNNVSFRQYSYWIQKMKDINNEDADITDDNVNACNDTIFADVSALFSDTALSGDIDCQDSGFQVYYKEARILIPLSFDKQVFTGIIKTLHEL